jgi:hypothetical protein
MFIDNIRYFLKHPFGTSYPYRRYFNKNKVIFIHIPKAAGTSILSALAKNKKIRRDHAPWYVYNNYNRWKFEHYFKFAFVRNPYDRAVSTYEYLANGGNKTDDMFFKEYFEKHGIDFEKFVLEYLDCNRLQEHILFKPQYLFIYDFQGNLKVDFVGRFESIDEDFEKLAEKIPLLQQLPKLNISKKRASYKTYYKNPVVVKKIQELYGKDFELLGYSKEIG